MQSQSRLLEDLARVASGALGVAAGMREEAEARLRDQFERVLARFDLVTREEFDVVKAMAVKAREEQEDLAARLAALEQAVEGKAAGRKTSATKPSRTKTARKKAAKAGDAD